jgi:putative ATP-binding cassette transporter
MFTTAYSMLATTLPLIIASPRYIMGMITLGALVQTAQAFQMVTSSLSWPVDNLAKLAEWRASAGRVLSFTAGLDAMCAKAVPTTSPQIQFEAGDAAELVLDRLAIAAPMGVPGMVPVTETIRLGDHVLINGDPELTERLPRVLARLWPWGVGRVALPREASIFFAPEHPYLPIGPLRGAICYPSLPEYCDLEAIPVALRRVGLAHLVPRQADSAAWEQALTRAERQLLGFARLLVHRPEWLVLEDAMTALDASDKAAIMALLAADFAGAAVITIGNGTSLGEFYQRKIMFAREKPADVAVPATGVHEEVAPGASTVGFQTAGA